MALKFVAFSSSNSTIVFHNFYSMSDLRIWGKQFVCLSFEVTWKTIYSERHWAINEFKNLTNKSFPEWFYVCVHAHCALDKSRFFFSKRNNRTKDNRMCNNKSIIQMPHMPWFYVVRVNLTSGCIQQFILVLCRLLCGAGETRKENEWKERKKWGLFVNP